MLTADLSCADVVLSCLTINDDHVALVTVSTSKCVRVSQKTFRTSERNKFYELHASVVVVSMLT